MNRPPSIVVPVHQSPWGSPRSGQLAPRHNPWAMPPSPLSLSTMAEEWNAMRTPLIHQHFILGHPRVLLSFLRFIDEHNELVEPEDVFDFKLPDKVIEHYKKHPSVQYPVAEFQQNVQELLERMEAHRRPSEPKLQ